MRRGGLQLFHWTALYAGAFTHLPITLLLQPFSLPSTPPPDLRWGEARRSNNLIKASVAPTRSRDVGKRSIDSSRQASCPLRLSYPNHGAFAPFHQQLNIPPAHRSRVQRPGNRASRGRDGWPAAPLLGLLGDHVSMSAEAGKWN